MDIIVNMARFMEEERYCSLYVIDPLFIGG
jgi:hypothetical protein